MSDNIVNDVIKENMGEEELFLLLQANCQKRNMQMNDMQKKIEILNGRIEILEESNKVYEKENESLKRQNTDFSDLIKELMEKSSATEAESDEHTKKVNKQIVQLEEKEKKLKAEIAKLQTESDEEKAKLRSELQAEKAAVAECAQKIKESREDLKRVKEHELALREQLKTQEGQNISLRKWMKKLEVENKELKKQVIALQRSGPPVTVRPAAAAEAAESEETPQKTVNIGENDLVMPAKHYNDSRTTKILPQVLDPLGKNLISLPSNSIGPEWEKNLVLACVSTHKEVDIDIRQALDSAKIGLLKPVVLVFSHLAKHKCNIQSTRERILDYNLVKRTKALIDVVYWQNKVYDCEINTIAQQKLQELWSATQEEDAAAI